LIQKVILEKEGQNGNRILVIHCILENMLINLQETHWDA